MKKLESDPQLKIELEENADELFQMAIEDCWSEDLAEKVVDQSVKTDSLKKGKARSSLSRNPIVIDLHGLSVLEAMRAVDLLIADELVKSANKRIFLRVITGKGLHSEDGVSVLAREVHYHIRKKYKHCLKKISESPDKLRVNGVPIRGHFDVILESVEGQ